MDRRDFIKLATQSGLLLTTPLACFRSKKQTKTAQLPALDLYEGPLYLEFQARGGMDVTMFCDPKGTPELNRSYTVDDIKTAGNIAYAPLNVADPTQDANQQFFSKYYQEMIVVNGLDMATTGHTTGRRAAATGNGILSTYPTFGALAAAVHGTGLPLAFMSFGGYDATGGLVPKTKITTPTRLEELANFDTNARSRSAYYNEFADSRLASEIQARHEDRMASRHLPRSQRHLANLMEAKSSTSEIKAMLSYLPSSMPSNSTLRGVAMTLAGYKAGICVSGNVYVSSFDSHSDNDARQTTSIARLVEAVDYAFVRAEELGIRDKLLASITTDFGRTNKYNANNGKDHWAIGSAVYIGSGISGNRVIGATDEVQKAMTINPSTLELDASSNGVRIRPQHLHLDLRRYAGLDTHTFSNRFRLAGESMPILTA